MKLDYFKTENFHTALQTFFENLNIPVNYLAEEPVRPQEILSDTYKPEHPAFRLMDDVYFLGMVDDAAFEGNASLAPEKIQSDYDGILIFGVTLHPRDHGLLPTRSQLAVITRAFNREYHYTPVVVVFKYEDKIAFANAERLKYKQEWREGEKAGKVSLLRDIDPDHPHSGHLRILSELAISRSGKKAINYFADLYSYWQTVFNVSLLNKKFYEELSNWYFWAIKEVTFPSEPGMESLVKETGIADEAKLRELKQEHNAKNVIRLLTRFLFVWFIKEKKLIPEELFDSKYLQKEILKDLSPLHEDGLFKSVNIQSHYYKAILQNLFFATLNCPIKSERGDKRRRGFSKANFGVLYLMRYENCFKNTDLFLEKVNEVVPFLNGGLFECLDIRGEKEKKEDRVYIDGFSDNLPKEHELIVPDYLFFGLNEEVDLSPIIGIANKKTKQAAVKGLINIFESYKFTIAENTPVEEDIALDPELLGKVFENLLASYNPETKTTARKQTGSFYTPREIVNYMVDESLIAYLKNKVEAWDMPEDELDRKLHQLFSFDAINPFAGNQKLQTAIIKALDHCTVLDPACGSGAFPMGILQKMVHVLQKVDPDNEHWHELQMQKALQATESALHLADRDARQQKLNEIEEAFDRQVNDPDYARKLFLIEDCIYGVDIQPIAAQISKLRFFISLVVDQKVDKSKDNFGIRPLPNLEMKFVAANTLVGIEKPEKERNLFENPEIKKLEAELKNVRHRIFSAKTPRTKRKLREADQELRERMGELLIADDWGEKTAKQLSAWDPYDQNASSPFFDSEWMFGIKDGFDVVIGNPPYIGHKGGAKNLFRKLKNTNLGRRFNNERMDIFYYFFHVSIDISSSQGVICFITTNYYPTADSAIKLRNDIIERTRPFLFVDFNELTLFESAKGQHNLLTFLSKDVLIEQCRIVNITSKTTKSERELERLLQGQSRDVSISIIKTNQVYDSKSTYFLVKGISEGSITISKIMDQVASKSQFSTGEKFNISQGVVTGIDKVSPKHGRAINKYLNRIGEGVFVVSSEFVNTLSENELELIKPWYKNSDIHKYGASQGNGKYLIHVNAETKLNEYPQIQDHLKRYEEIIRLRNYESGELSKAKKLGSWWALSSSRREFDFSTPKIIAPQRSYSNTFGYTDESWCASADVYFITQKKDDYDLLCLLLLLNSKLYYHWLYNRGKRKGDMLELYLTPLAAIPIPELSANFSTLFHFLSILHIHIASIDHNPNLILQDVSDAVVLELFFNDHMQEREINVLQYVEQDIAGTMPCRKFEQLPNSEQDSIINELHSRWSHPDSEVYKRINLFSVRSPDILKPILESR